MMWDVTYTRALLAQSYWNYLKEVIQFHVTKVGKLHSRFSFVFIKKGGMDTYIIIWIQYQHLFFLNKIKFGYIRSMYIYIKSPASQIMHLNEFVDFSRIAWNYRFCITAVYMKYLQWRMTIGSQSATFAHVICNGQQFVWYISTLSQMLQLCFISCLIINYLHFER